MQASEELEEIKNVVESNWKKLAQQYGLNRVRLKIRLRCLTWGINLKKWIYKEIEQIQSMKPQLQNKNPI